MRPWVVTNRDDANQTARGSSGSRLAVKAVIASTHPKGSGGYDLCAEPGDPWRCGEWRSSPASTGTVREMRSIGAVESQHLPEQRKGPVTEPQPDAITGTEFVIDGGTIPVA
jgi:hypothetical protein